MNTIEIVIIAGATLLGPILAVQAQKFLERTNERRRGQLQVFYWLMASRATRLSTEHVQALNRIELEFRGKSTKEKAIRDAWRLYADKLNEQFDPTTAATWAASREALFTDLIFEMSKYLGFDFDRVQIMRGVYYPRGHGEIEERQKNILAYLEKALDGSQPIPMRIVESPANPEAAKLQAELAAKMATAYSEDGALKVRILATEN